MENLTVKKTLDGSMKRGKAEMAPYGWICCELSVHYLAVAQGSLLQTEVAYCSNIKRNSKPPAPLRN